MMKALGYEHVTYARFFLFYDTYYEALVASSFL